MHTKTRSNRVKFSGFSGDVFLFLYLDFLNGLGSVDPVEFRPHVLNSFIGLLAQLFILIGQRNDSGAVPRIVEVSVSAPTPLPGPKTRIVSHFAFESLLLLESRGLFPTHLIAAIHLGEAVSIMPSIVAALEVIAEEFGAREVRVLFAVVRDESMCRRYETKRSSFAAEKLVDYFRG